MIKLVFFDWNGTILSDTAASLASVNKVLALFDVNPVTIKRYRELFEIPITKFYSDVGVNEKIFSANHSKIQKTFHDSYEKRARHCRTRSGAHVLLKWLHSEGIKSVILSNHTVDGIYPHLRRLKLERYVDAVLANDSILHTGLKDKTRRAEDFAKENKIDPKQILVVGDSPEEARIARQLGARSVLVTGGWSSESRLNAAKPDYVIKRIDRLIEIVKEDR
jgi:phosphoglycolate phosphatase